MSSSPLIQIAYHLLSAEGHTHPTPAQASALAALITPADLCPACWRLFSCGVRGRSFSDDCLLSDTHPEE